MCQCLCMCDPYMCMGIECVWVWGVYMPVIVCTMCLYLYPERYLEVYTISSIP